MEPYSPWRGSPKVSMPPAIGCSLFIMLGARLSMLWPDLTKSARPTASPWALAVPAVLRNTSAAQRVVGSCGGWSCGVEPSASPLLPTAAATGGGDHRCPCIFRRRAAAAVSRSSSEDSPSE
eukprot:479235-Prymnesium_polylepis.1